MSNIDFTKIVTADDKAAEGHTARIGAVKAECSKRIFNIADQNSQMNLTAAASASTMTSGQMSSWKSALIWVSDMRAACVPLILDPTGDLTADEHWPMVPAGVVELVQEF